MFDEAHVYEILSACNDKNSPTDLQLPNEPCIDHNLVDESLLQSAANPTDFGRPCDRDKNFTISKYEETTILNFIQNFKTPCDEQPKEEPSFEVNANPDFHLLAEGANSDSREQT